MIVMIGELIQCHSETENQLTEYEQHATNEIHAMVQQMTPDDLTNSLVSFRMVGVMSWFTDFLQKTNFTSS